MTPEILLAVIGTFVLVAVSVEWGVSAWTTAHSAGAKRVRALIAESQPSFALPSEGGLVGVLDPRLARLSRLLPRRSAADQSSVQLQLTRAGYRREGAIVWYSLARLALPLACAGAAVLVAPAPRGPYVVAAAVAGFLLPRVWVSHRITVRQKAIWNGLPDLLDLLTLCVEAGTGLDSAISKATAELEISHPVLADETRLMTTEIRAGRPRQEAFANLATRTGLDDIRTLTTMLAQTDRFGTSIAQALRTHADTTRTVRRQRAQERAAKMGVKLIFPLALCLFPALYLVIFGPVAVKLFRTLIHPGA